MTDRPVRLHFAFTESPIRWLVRNRSYRVLRSRLGPNFRVANPLFVARLERERINPQRFGARPATCVVTDDGVIVQTHSIGLLWDSTEPEPTPGELLPEHLPRAIEALRYASRQAEVAFRGRGVSTIRLGRERPLTVGDFIKGSSKLTDRYLVRTAISPEHLRRAHKALLNGAVPVAHIILLDAVSAFARFDHRQAILYAAMAVEAAVTRWLDSRYQAIRSRAGAAGRYRVSQIPGSGGLVRKDPVYALMTTQKRFSILLHEKPLYLTGRSIRMDKPALYEEARTLYRTRNRIVHRGDPGLNDVLDLTIEGGRRALRCAMDVFEWIGEGEGYCIPGMGTSPCKGTATLS